MTDIVTGTVFKHSHDVSVGMSLQGSAPNITIAKINPSALCASTELEPGMILESINGRTFHTNDEAVRCVKESIGQVVIVARRPGPGAQKQVYVSSFDNEDYPEILMPEYDTPTIIQAELNQLNADPQDEELSHNNRAVTTSSSGQNQAAPQPRDLLPEYQPPQISPKLSREKDYAEPPHPSSPRAPRDLGGISLVKVTEPNGRAVQKAPPAREVTPSPSEEDAKPPAEKVKKGDEPLIVLIEKPTKTTKVGMILKGRFLFLLFLLFLFLCFTFNKCKNAHDSLRFYFCNDSQDSILKLPFRISDLTLWPVRQNWRLVWLF